MVLNLYLDFSGLVWSLYTFFAGCTTLAISIVLFIVCHIISVNRKVKFNRLRITVWFYTSLIATAILGLGFFITNVTGREGRVFLDNMAPYAIPLGLISTMIVGFFIWKNKD